MNRVNGKMRFLMRHKSGFTLIEAMIALVLLTIGMLAIASGEIQSITMNKRSQETLKAISAAESMIEMIRRNGADLDSYHNFHVTATSTASTGTSTTMREADQRSFSRAIAEIAGTGTSSESVTCGGVTTNTTCGWIAMAPSRFNNVMPEARNVTVNIVWPGHPNGITLTAEVSP